MSLPTWFPASSNDRFAPDDQIVLGSIITNPKQPENSLNNPADLVPIPTSLYIKTVCDLDYSSEVERNRDHNAGIQLKAADFIDSEVSHGQRDKNKHGIDAERFMSKNFRPDANYVADSAAKKVIVDYLKQEVCYFMKTAPRLYMITGIRIAHQALISRSREVAITDKANIGASIWSMPVSAGPFGERTAEDKGSETFRPDGEFVYAVRLKKFVFQRKKPVLEMEYFTDGAKLYDGEKKTKVEGPYEFEVISEEDVTADMFKDIKTASIIDRDEGCFKIAVWSNKEDEG
ncbi:hypothetical protein V493_06530 [Pseudogymnoascus sp. VKM F-4281 (FW-2241)]|nr:hypothetical protein V493_06530 [Pseudogymnoascus sp. VKM F-4281 (FW-2241)]